MPLAFLLVGTGIAFVWSALSGKGVVETFKSVIQGQTVDTSLQAGTFAPAQRSFTGLRKTVQSTSSSTPSTAGLDPAGHSIPDLQNYARALLAQRGWSDQWTQFNALVMGESGWVWNARNPGQRGYLDERHAYGIPQALPPSKMLSAGADWKTNGYTQLRWMMEYIAGRYGNPANAYRAWQNRVPHWY